MPPYIKQNSRAEIGCFRHRLMDQNTHQPFCPGPEGELGQYDYHQPFLDFKKEEGDIMIWGGTLQEEEFSAGNQDRKKSALN